MSYVNKGSMPTTVMVSLEPDRSGNFVCDGTADQVEILAAITYLVNAYGGGTVHLKAGNYDVAATVAITDDSILLEGEGNATILTLADVNGISFTGAGAYPNTLQRGGMVDLKIVGFEEPHTQSGVRLLRCNYVYIHNVSFEECFICIYESNGGNNFILGNHCTLFYDKGMRIDGTENLIECNSIDISYGTGVGSASKQGINLVGGGNIIVGNVIEGVVGTGGDGLIGAGNANLLSGNSFTECGRYGINISGDLWCLSGNYFDDNGSQQLIIYGDDNFVDGNFFYNGGAYGIYFGGTSTRNRIGINFYFNNASGPVFDANEQKYQSKVFPFVEGGDAGGIQVAQFIHADASPKGWEINAVAKWAIALGQMPLNVFQVVKIKIWAVGLAQPAAQMRVDIDVNAGGSDEPFTTEAIDVNDKESEETNFAANDVFHWMIDATDDEDIDDIRGGDSVEVKAKYNAGGGGDMDTDAVFRCVEIEYV